MAASRPLLTRLGDDGALSVLRQDPIQTSRDSPRPELTRATLRRIGTHRLVVSRAGSAPTCRAGRNQSNHAWREPCVDSRIGPRFRIAPEDARLLRVLRKILLEQSPKYHSSPSRKWQRSTTTGGNVRNSLGLDSSARRHKQVWTISATRALIAGFPSQRAARPCVGEQPAGHLLIRFQACKPPLVWGMGWLHRRARERTGARVAIDRLAQCGTPFWGTTGFAGRG